jgi:hypothetical protein
MQANAPSRINLENETNKFMRRSCLGSRSNTVAVFFFSLLLLLNSFVFEIDQKPREYLQYHEVPTFCLHFSVFI